MKNEYEINGDITTIFLYKKDGTRLEALIDTVDLEKVKEFPNTWHAKWEKDTQSYYVHGKLLGSNGKRKSVYLHRWLFDSPKGMVVDHKNHITLDNTRKNLRILTTSQNIQNRKGATRSSKSGVRGVYWDKQVEKWCAALRVNGKQINVGRFRDIKDAKLAILEARKKYMPYSKESM